MSVERLDASTLRPNFWRAPTDNDFGAGLQHKMAVWKQPEMKLKTLTHAEAGDAKYSTAAAMSLTSPSRFIGVWASIRSSRAGVITVDKARVRVAPGPTLFILIPIGPRS